MSVEFVYSVGGDRLGIKLGQSEAQAISRLSVQFPSEGRALFDAQELGEADSVPAQALVAAAERLLTALKSGAADVGAVYSFESTDRNGQRWSTSTGLQTPIGGVDHSFRAGRDECTMQSLHRDAEMRVIARGDVIDLRGRTSVQTDHGELRIKRAPAAKALAPAIRKVRDFAAKHGDATVEKIVM